MRAILMLAIAMLAVPGVAADPVPAGCSEKSVSSGTSPEHIVTTHADCSIDVELNRGIICVGGWGRTDHHEAGPVHVIHHRCTFPGGDPTPPVAMQGPCGQTHHLGVGTLYVHGDCTVQLDVKFYECVWGGHWVQHTPPPVQVREYRCGPPPS